MQHPQLFCKTQTVISHSLLHTCTFLLPNCFASILPFCWSEIPWTEPAWAPWAVQCPFRLDIDHLGLIINQVSTFILSTSRCGRGLLQNSSISSKIPSPRPTPIPNRLPSNIPLRTLPAHAAAHDDSSHSNRNQATSSFLAPRPPAEHSRYSDDDDEDYNVYGSSESSWVDTGDIAEQLDHEDPLRQRLYDTLEDKTHASVIHRHPKRHRHITGGKHVHYPESLSRSSTHSSRSLSGQAGAVNKEAIHIPDAAPRTVSRAERLIASIMAGTRNPIHGLTGKPLIYFTSIFVSLGVFLFGYDQGVMSGIITCVKPPLLLCFLWCAPGCSSS